MKTQYLVFSILLLFSTIHAQNDALEKFIYLRYQGDFSEILPHIDAIGAESQFNERIGQFLKILEKKFVTRFTPEEILQLRNLAESDLIQKESKMGLAINLAIRDSVSSFLSDALFRKKIEADSLFNDEKYENHLLRYLELSKPVAPDEKAFAKGFTSGLLGIPEELSEGNNKMPQDSIIGQKIATKILASIYSKHFSLDDLKGLIDYYENSVIKKLRELEFSLFFEALEDFSMQPFTEEPSTGSLNLLDPSVNPVAYNNFIQNENRKIFQLDEEESIFSLYEENLSLLNLKYEAIVSQIDSSIAVLEETPGFKGDLDLRSKTIAYWKEYKSFLEYQNRLSNSLNANFSYKNLKIVINRTEEKEKKLRQAQRQVEQAQIDFATKYKIKYQTKMDIIRLIDFTDQVISYAVSLYVLTIDPMVILEEFFEGKEEVDFASEDFAGLFEDVIISCQSSMNRSKEMGPFEKDTIFLIKVGSFLKKLESISIEAKNVITSCLSMQDLTDKAYDILFNHENTISNLELTNEDLKLWTRTDTLMRRALRGETWIDLKGNLDQNLNSLGNLHENFNFFNEEIGSMTSSSLKSLKSLRGAINNCLHRPEIYEKLVNFFNKDFFEIEEDYEQFLKRHIERGYLVFTRSNE